MWLVDQVLARSTSRHCVNDAGIGLWELPPDVEESDRTGYERQPEGTFPTMKSIPPIVGRRVDAIVDMSSIAVAVARPQSRPMAVAWSRETNRCERTLISEDS
ncbi:MAG: hypothetical protein JO372_07455 [Solirubrobacterales bacterium]|nr:hypothetical protein [Solirubrobacterales bacterium]